MLKNITEIKQFFRTCNQNKIRVVKFSPDEVLRLKNIIIAEFDMAGDSYMFQPNKIAATTTYPISIFGVKIEEYK